MNTPSPAQVENPWIAIQCGALSTTRNKLPTFLQEQYGQLGEDLILEGILKSWFARRGLAPQDIRYLEVGANHPIQTSNTYLFARKWGGSGVLVEANPDLVEALSAVRPRDQVLNLAVVPPGYPARVSINISTHAELSSLDPGHIRSFGRIGTIDKTVEVGSTRLDDLLDSRFANGIHLLSIDIEGLDLEVIRHSSFRVRPVFIVTEPSRHYHADAEAGFTTVLGAKGYVEVARTDYNLIFGDATVMPHGVATTPPAIAPPVELRTFDVFDTLIARRCVTAHAVFDEVERRTGCCGFAAERKRAERAVEKGEYTLTDIYLEMIRSSGMDEDTARQLQAMELQVELENVVPIADHIAELDECSVLVSDMYLPDDVIRMLLSAAGVGAALPLLRSSHGKRSGRLWNELARAGLKCAHLGDHPESDRARPLAAGMKARLTRLSQVTPTEKAISDAGLASLAESLRAARLMTRRGDLATGLHRLQVELNLPLLAVSALVLHSRLAESTHERVLFSSRDARYLHMIFDAVAAASGKGGPQSAYWHTSRIARTQGDAGYLAYCRELIGTGAVLVDLCGTGASLELLRMQLGLPSGQMPVFLCQAIDQPDLRDALTARYGLKQAPAPQALWTNRDLVGNEVLELLNYVPEGMTLGVHAVPGGFIPVRAAIEFDGDQLNQIREQARMAREFAAHLRSTLVPAAFAEVETRAPELIAAFRALIPGLHAAIQSLNDAWLGLHREREAGIAARLGRA